MKTRTFVVLWMLTGVLMMWLCASLAGCGTITHALNLPTLDDIEGVRADQKEVDRKQVEAQAEVDRQQARITADVLTLRALPEDIVEGTEAAIRAAGSSSAAAAHASDYAYRSRTPPPTPGGVPDWAVIVGSIAAAGATYLTARAGVLASQANKTATAAAANTQAAHVEIARTKESLAATDEWVEEIEKKKASGA